MFTEGTRVREFIHRFKAMETSEILAAQDIWSR
jgi:hypothetical protein